MLEPGTRLRTTTADSVEVVALIGSGGQGEVYKVAVGGRTRALKWYFPAVDTDTADQRAIVEELVARDLRDPRFLWPDALVCRADGRAGFGYLMNLRPAEYEGLPALFRRRVKTTTRVLLTSAIHLVEAYRTLHSRGIAYRDISWGNVFFDPTNGDVLVCDNDNAVVEGQVATIVGTMEFMAPELVRGEPGASPRTQTDLHSLAVLLFMLLMNHHPLEGALEEKIRCLDEKAKIKLYGKDPVFVFDPTDTRNRPVAGVHDTVLATWSAASRSVRSLFIRAFTDGMHNPDRRVRESEWRDVLSQARDALVNCAGCGRQNMADPGDVTRPGEPSDTGRTCWGCGKVLLSPVQLVLTTPAPRTVRTMMIGRDFAVYPHHLVVEPERHDFSSPVATLTEHPTRPGRFGLTNLSPQQWTVSRPDGTTQTLGQGQTVAVRNGLRISINGVAAEIRASANRS